MTLIEQEYMDWCNPPKRLSKRDMRIAEMYAKGDKIEAIADALCLSNQAISNALTRNVYPHFGVSGNRAQRRAQMARELGGLDG